jgi:hypothetical protein
MAEDEPIAKKATALSVLPGMYNDKRPVQALNHGAAFAQDAHQEFLHALKAQAEQNRLLTKGSRRYTYQGCIWKCRTSRQPNPW